MSFLTHVILFALLTVESCRGISRQDHFQLQRPRCTSRCIGSYAEKILQARMQTRNNSRGSISVNDVMKQCLSSRDVTCKTCLQPCQRKFIGLADCMALCDGELECHYSCAFLNDMRKDKMGYCTAPTEFDTAVKVTYWAGNSSYTLTPGQKGTGRNARSTCDVECQSDFDCFSSKKCCNVDCAPSCRRAVIRKSWVPWLPDENSVRISERSNAGLRYAEISWLTKNKNIQDLCVIYLVQEKSAVGRDTPKFSKYGWHTIHETTESSISLMHLKRGWWYKYRIAAVNSNGTRGFTKETKPFALSENPRPPPSPVRLELSSIRIRSGARYNILTRWKLAEDRQSDLPMKGFYVTTKKKLEKDDVTKLDKKFVRFSKSVQSSGTVYWTSWITGLRMFVPYEVSVVSAANWEDDLLTSRAAINISFQYPPIRPSQVVRNLSVQLPFMTWNRSVSVNITWDFLFTEAPVDLVKFAVNFYTTECFSGERKNMKMWTLESNTFYFLNDLDFACEYEVSVQAMYGTFRHQRSDPRKIRFSTPPCGIKQYTMLSRSKDKRDISAGCSSGGSAPFVQYQVYQVIKQATNETFYAELQWRPLQFVLYDALFLYLTYGDDKPLKWIYIPAQHLYCVLQSLQPSSAYTVRFIPVKNKNAGPVTTQAFNTPAVLGGPEVAQKE